MDDILILFVRVQRYIAVPFIDHPLFAPGKIGGIDQKLQKVAPLPFRRNDIRPFALRILRDLYKRRLEQRYGRFVALVFPDMVRYVGVMQLFDTILNNFPTNIRKIEHLLIPFGFSEIRDDKGQSGKLIRAEVLRPAFDDHFQDIFRSIHFGKLLQIVAYLPRLHSGDGRRIEMYPVKGIVQPLIPSESPIVKKDTGTLVFKFVCDAGIAVPVTFFDFVPILLIAFDGLCAFQLPFIVESPPVAPDQELGQVFKNIFMKSGEFVR